MPGAEQDRLDSWKAIADYLGRDLRTVRRWENDRALPVHRVPGGGRAAVYAFRTEIDAWLRGQEGKPSATSGPESDSALPVSSPPRFAGGSDAQTTPDLGAGARSGTVAHRASPRNRVLRWGGLLALAGGLVFFAIWGWRYFYGGPVERVTFSGSKLVAWNERGKTLWTYPFDQPLNLRPDNLVRQRVAIVDLGPGRRQDILVGAPFYSGDRVNSPSDAFYCLSAQGKLRWQHSFDDTVRVGGHDYGPPWLFGPLIVTSDGVHTSIWCTAWEVFSSASTLVELDRDGNELAQFMNWGHIAALNHMSDATGSYILVGGISNQRDCAFLAVLRADHASGGSPPVAPAFQCDNCPPGKPYRYILFPHSELTELSGTAYNNLKLIQVEGGHVSVGVSETASLEVPGPDWKQYDLSNSFVPQSVWVSDHFWTLHRQMEAEGKIHHTVEQCPERTQPQTVSMWSPEDGWKEIKVPVVPVPR